MMVRLHSAALKGVEAIKIDVEISNTNAHDFRLNLVGLPDAAVS